MVHEEEKLRSDARTNRGRILDVARVALAADPQAPLSGIARTAGVGQGTLYRHFASREALVLGLCRTEIAGLVALAPTLLAARPPLIAFRTWCDRLAEFGRLKHGVADLLHTAMSDRDVDETYGPMVGAVRLLMDRCESAGDIKPGADAEDILVLLTALWRIAPNSAGRAQAERLQAFIFRGLGAQTADADEAIPP